ncbi:putative Membrane-bound lytic murein transglycosylase A [Magnetospirillum gryphiswaldense MSR-1 v2]|uniref:peptidoglycan lytic exotransglycosylase n=1 Tax=Magnetospirillum gryphiswaldense (strain DSM 6361 / JCM 21280 / NBRC 15271 / MSR-1) TaxID=431944 RepID=V6F873_MAGGM|nr:MltA domain-containing protein [Magnetospirillum gryphiswaldense]CDL00718.1 putative Membrane-bound lytic murein transglycosylase A [Magnetospirillum gryphiswaldense MSR-1 v2]
MKPRLAVLLLAALAASCAPETPRRPPPVPGPAPLPQGPDQFGLIPAQFNDLPGWRADGAAAVLPALNRTCDRVLKQPNDKSIGQNGMGGTVADWYSPCSAARRVGANDHEAARVMFEEWFVPFLAVNNGSADGLFTGYFEPELAGSRTKKGRFTVPILGKPRDLVTRKGADGSTESGRMVDGRFTPYPSRAEIEAGAIAAQATPLAWVEDPVDAHILHIQGSGRIRLEDGSVLRLGVAATNGHKFVGISKILRERGLIEDTPMPGVRAWLKANPARAKALMAENPRYVFYTPISGDGPVGSEGVALTAGRSMAVDPRYVALGLPLFLDTVEPSGQPLRRLVMAQDTGAAIKGPIRGDFFWGTGEEAFDKAGRMKSPGRYWILLPQRRSPRIAMAEEQNP